MRCNRGCITYLVLPNYIWFSYILTVNIFKFYHPTNTYDLTQEDNCPSSQYLFVICYLLSRKLDNPKIINFTANKSNVYNESNALATTNTTEQEKVDMVNKQMETTTEQKYTRLVMPQPKQQHEVQ